jgi:hypothetical protein
MEHNAFVFMDQEMWTNEGLKAHEERTTFENEGITSLQNVGKN